MGPTVCELEGPIPMVKRSKTLIDIGGDCIPRPGKAFRMREIPVVLSFPRAPSHARSSRVRPEDYRGAAGRHLRGGELPSPLRPLPPSPLPLLLEARLSRPGLPRPNPGDVPGDLQRYRHVPAGRAV